GDSGNTPLFYRRRRKRQPWAGDPREGADGDDRPVRERHHHQLAEVEVGQPAGHPGVPVDIGRIVELEYRWGGSPFYSIAAAERVIPDLVLGGPRDVIRDSVIRVSVAIQVLSGAGVVAVEHQVAVDRVDAVMEVGRAA